MSHSSEYWLVCQEAHPEECVVCGAEEDLVVHHVDGDRSNNDPENLRFMCRSCHRSVHNGGNGVEEWTDQLPERSVIDRSSIMDLRSRELEILSVLSDGRSNPKYIRETTGLEKGQVTTGLNRLGKFGLVCRINRGLYRIADKGRREVNAETDRTAVDVAQLRTALDDVEAAAGRGDGAALQDALRRAREAIDEAQ